MFSGTVIALQMVNFAMGATVVTVLIILTMRKIVCEQSELVWIVIHWRSIRKLVIISDCWHLIIYYMLITRASAWHCVNGDYAFSAK